MPYYDDLNPKSAAFASEWRGDEQARRRAVERLLALRTALASGDGAPPPRRLNTLLLATWNIREFDSTTWGARLPEVVEVMSGVEAAPKV